ncbi:MAG: prepilin-type N-terminal cleavage/methylation domain-containing protein [Actinomycetota bacterium]|nr:prepilin-type N-terminal cleavage/methylation domain-containing protein [Actinomycetota bacterium]
MRSRDPGGFTTVELMVVVLIIGILVAIAIPVFNVARGRAQERACFANQRTIIGAVQQWVADNTEADRADLTGVVDRRSSPGTRSHPGGGPALSLLAGTCDACGGGRCDRGLHPYCDGWPGGLHLGYPGARRAVGGVGTLVGPEAVAADLEV